MNDVPTTSNWTSTGNEDTSISTTLSGSDIDGDPLTFILDQNVSHGTLSFSATGVITYVPFANFYGIDTFTFHVFDGQVNSSTLTGSISITSVNDVPTATGESVVLTEDTNAIIPVLANDSDADGDALTIANLTQPGTGGTVSISGTDVLFVPTPNFCTPNPITFTYQARDTASALSAVTTVTISSITCVNDVPTSLNGSFTMTGNIVINS